MIIAKNTSKNMKIIEKIADLEMDFDMFHHIWTDEIINQKLSEISKLYKEIE